MENVPEHLLEIGEWSGDGYKPVLDFHGWRVAMLRYGEAVERENFQRVERHTKTNEVFILTGGQADLIVMDGDGSPTIAHVFPMRLNVAYNIAQSVWHHVVMSRDAHIVLVERSDTSLENSDYAHLAADVIATIRDQFTV